LPDFTGQVSPAVTTAAFAVQCQIKAAANKRVGGDLQSPRHCYAVEDHVDMYPREGTEWVSVSQIL